MAFRSLHIIEPILKALAEEGYTKPTPIQAQAIPIVLSGSDLLGIAQTGTGKTAAFAIPIIQHLAANKSQVKHRPIRCLVVTPTRELAVQINDSFKAYGRYAELKSTVIFGGVNQNKQTSALNRGVDIVIATPGRLLDLMHQRHVSLAHVEMFVLDEADRMLDMGFLPEVKRIVAELPKKKQSLFFSATMPPPIARLAHEILHHPEKVEVTPPASTVELIDQSLYFVDRPKKTDLLVHLLESMDIGSALVFTRTKHGADVVVRNLERKNIYAEAIHGNKSQNNRQRALTNFKAGKTPVLVATDIAARGIDIDDLAYVFNYDIPNEPETYVHRIGRTGRAGAAGNAIAFCAPDEKGFVRAIERLIGKRIPVVRENPFASSERAAHHKPYVAGDAAKDVVAERLRERQQQQSTARTEPVRREHHPKKNQTADHPTPKRNEKTHSHKPDSNKPKKGKRNWFGRRRKQR
ncbi:MAG TPA: DEAD/DEAH box helicase [Candidatus Kapabacteria bacterium]|nr:DEAD/DEAH box helicase [Candidatus Kapabacteria bacterium]